MSSQVRRQENAATSWSRVSPHGVFTLPETLYAVWNPFIVVGATVLCAGAALRICTIEPGDKIDWRVLAVLLVSGSWVIQAHA